VSCGETADPIDIQFGTKTQVGQGNSVLGGARISQGEGAIMRVVSTIQVHCNSESCENCSINCRVYITYWYTPAAFGLITIQA